MSLGGWRLAQALLEVKVLYVFSFEGVALLPFVDERRLWAALDDVYPDLTPEEGECKTLDRFSFFNELCLL